MSDIKFQDYNRIVSQVVAVAMGPDGKPALLSSDKPAGAIVEAPSYNASAQITAIAYYSAFNAGTETPSGLIATKNIIWNTSGNGAGQPKFIYWT